MKNLEVGDVVIPTNDTQLFIYGCGRHTHAICVSVDPLILISDQGDTRWNNIDKDDIITLCKADADVIKIAMARLARDKAQEYSPDAFYQRLKLVHKEESEREVMRRVINYVEGKISEEDLLSIDRLLFIFDPADFVHSYLPISLLRSSSRLQRHRLLVHWAACRDRIWKSLENEPDRKRRIVGKRRMVGLLEGLDV